MAVEVRESTLAAFLRLGESHIHCVPVRGMPSRYNESQWYNPLAPSAINTAIHE